MALDIGERGMEPREVEVGGDGGNSHPWGAQPCSCPSAQPHSPALLRTQGIPGSWEGGAALVLKGSESPQTHSSALPGFLPSQESALCKSLGMGREGGAVCVPTWMESKGRSCLCSHFSHHKPRFKRKKQPTKLKTKQKSQNYIHKIK